MVAITLSFPQRAEYSIFRHPPAQDQDGMAGGLIRLVIPPYYGYSIKTPPLTHAQADKLAGEINTAMQNEVVVAIADKAPTNASTITVGSVSGLDLTLSGFTGTWYENKVLSIMRGTRRYLVPTTGPKVGNVVKMAATPRVTFLSGDAITYNSPQIQGVLFNPGDVLKQINSGDYSNGVELIIRENK